jgi:hypothetical protein
MIGSGDEDGIHDVMVNHGLTELEAVLYLAIMDYGDRSVPAEVADQARHHAAYLIQHLPEHTDDNASERQGDEPASERTD